MNKLNFILCFFLLGFTLQISEAQVKDKPKFITSVEGIKEYSLNNGMQVLLIPDETQSNAIINIVYHVGSRHEGYGETGMAHLLEHMLFKSTKNLGDIKSMLSAKGGQANGTTWLDRTNYYEIFTANDENLKWFLEMEADRMVNATILQSDLDKEFSVVRNEFEIGENSPDGVLNERVISTAFIWHNYGNSTIGSREDIERVKADRLRVFYEKYYQPDNATLIIGGKFDEKNALDYIATYFGTIPRPKRVLEPTYTVEPAQDGERFVELRRTGDKQLVAAAYHTSAYSYKDFAALEALQEILTSDPSGYLYKALVETQKASSLYAWQPTTRDPSFMYFNVEVPKDKSLDVAKAEFLSQLDQIGSRTYTEKDLDRAKTKLLKNLENRQNNTIGFTIGLTEIVGAGDYRLGFLYRDNIENLKLTDIQHVAKKYFIPSNRTLGLFIPTEKTPERVFPAEISQEQIASLTQNYKGKEMEEALSSFEASIANVKANTTEGKLANGMKYAILKKPIKGNKVIAQFRFPAGDEKSLENKQYIASLTAQLLTTGTKTKTREQIQDDLDALKSSVYFGFGGQNLVLNVSTYEESLPQVMAMVNEMLTESTFLESELNKIILETVPMLEQAKNDPQNIVFTEMSRRSSNYPKSHIFYTATSTEEIAGMKAVTVKQVKDFYQQFLGANNGVGVLVGNMDPANVSSLLTKTFGNWNAKNNYKRIEPTYFATKKSSERIITPDKENAAASGVMSFKLKESDKDYPAMLMADAMIGSGGFMTARIPNRLRETEGISYGAGSFMNVPIMDDVASWGSYAFYNPTKVDLVESALKEEISKVIDKGFTKEEFESSLNSWNNERTTNLGNDGYLARLISNALYYNQPIEKFDELSARVNALKVEDINKTLKKYLNLDNFIMIMAGDFDKK